MEETGADVDYARLDLAKSDNLTAEYLKKNPKGRVATVAAEQGYLIEGRVATVTTEQGYLIESPAILAWGSPDLAAGELGAVERSVIGMSSFPIMETTERYGRV